LLKETTQEKGCLDSCLWSIIFGGTLGAILGYFISEFFSGNQSDHKLFLLLRWAFGAVGFVIGMIVWILGQWIYIRYFAKDEEEEVI